MNKGHIVPKERNALMIYDFISVLKYIIFMDPVFTIKFENLYGLKDIRIKSSVSH